MCSGKGKGTGGIFGPVLPSALPLVPRLRLVQQMGRRGRGVTPQPVREASSSDRASAACQKGFINASRGSTRSPSVLHDPRQGGQSTAVAQKSVAAWRDGPLPPAMDPAGSATALCASALRPFPWATGTAHSYPLSDARQEIQALKSLGLRGFKNPSLITEIFHQSCSLLPSGNRKGFCRNETNDRVNVVCAHVQQRRNLSVQTSLVFVPCCCPADELTHRRESQAAFQGFSG